MVKTTSAEPEPISNKETNQEKKILCEKIEQQLQGKRKLTYDDLKVLLFLIK